MNMDRIVQQFAGGKHRGENHRVGAFGATRKHSILGEKYLFWKAMRRMLNAVNSCLRYDRTIYETAAGAHLKTNPLP